MSIDDIISLLLFLVFIVVPILSRVGRRKPQQGRGTNPQTKPQTRGQATPQRGQAAQGRGASVGRSSSQPSSQQTPEPSMSDDFSKRLEEARRRVQEAMEGQSAQGRNAPSTGQESAGDLFRPSTPASSPQQLSTPNTPSTPLPTSLVTQRPVSQSFLPSESETASGSFGGSLGRFSGQSLGQRKKMGVSKPLQVQRSLKGKRAKLQGRLLTFGESDLMRGIIWKQILDEPRAKQSWREQSQHR